MGFDNYIELDNVITSRSGLYADSLPGIDVETIDGLRKNGQTTNTTWDVLYKRACDNLVSDVSKNIQDKFFVNSKIVSRQTSAFLADYNSAGVAGIKLTLKLSRYTKTHIISVALWAQIDYTNLVINFYDTDADGELLLTKTQNVTAGRNTINVDTDFEVDTLYIVVNTSNFTIKKTENRFYHGMSTLSSTVCFECCGGQGSVEQVNGGGLDVKYVVFCSIDKFVVENINLFRQSLLWKLGVEITHERRYGERLNRLTIMTVERATELEEYYKTQYEQEIMDAIHSQNIREDAVCFACKSPSYTAISLP